MIGIFVVVFGCKDWEVIWLYEVFGVCVGVGCIKWWMFE